jgi:hypothetical protein
MIGTSSDGLSNNGFSSNGYSSAPVFSGLTVSSSSSVLVQSSSSVQVSSSSSITEASSSSVHQPIDACSISSQNPTGYAQVGNIAPNVTLTTYDGRSLRLCELGGEKPIVIKTGYKTCGFCTSISRDISNNTSYWTPQEFVDMINDDEIILVEMITGENDNNNPNLGTAQWWHNEYPHDKVYVTIDQSRQLWNHIRRGDGAPQMFLIGADYKWAETSSIRSYVWEALGIQL